MVKRKIEDIEIEEKILNIIDYERTSLSIRKITSKLKERFDVVVSPQVVKRYLLKLKKEGKIIGI